MRRILALVSSFGLLCWLALLLREAVLAAPVPVSVTGDRLLVIGEQEQLVVDHFPLTIDHSPLTITIPYTIYLPLLFTPPPPLPPPLPPPVPYSATPPIDFTAVRADLQEQGLDLAFNKIGFHTAFSDYNAQLQQWMAALDAAGVPFVVKSVDNAQPLVYAQQLMQQSGVPHILIYRRSSPDYDLPNYNLPPDVAAQEHWARHMAVWPQELDPSLVWIETVNEVDKNRTPWLAEFALETAQLALADGYKWAAFGWSSGEPEPIHWAHPTMRQFLELAAEHPDRLAIALHEYSYEVDDIGRWYPYLVGRFQLLFQVCDAYGIERPTVLITEWGWVYNHVPPPEIAMQDIQWASWLYAAYPQVKGAALWYLGGGFGGIANEAALLIGPVGDYGRSHYFAYTPGIGMIDPTLFAPD
ncbi:MAG TPA: hypothetical protein PLD25_20175 [Chloroflexota bacterium]|nr:hypothetical protein [Chloroflexota bacterium]